MSDDEDWKLILDAEREVFSADSDEAHPLSSIHIGTQILPNRGRRMMLTPDVRQYHMHVPGTIGSGKTNLMLKMIREDIEAGHGVVVFDPTGNLYNDIVRWLTRTLRLVEDPGRYILIDPNMTEYSFRYNPLHIRGREGMNRRELDAAVVDVVSDVVLSFDAMMDEESQSKPLQTRFFDVILKTLAYLDLTLADALLFVQQKHKEMRRFIGANVPDERIRAEWEFLAQLRPEQYATWMMAPENRLNMVHSSPTLRYMFGQRENDLDFVEAADSAQVVLINLSRSSPGVSRQQLDLLGRLLVNDLTRSMRYRQRTSFGEKPRGMYCYIDECHNYINRDIENALNELRQFGLSFILGHQNPGQLEKLGPSVKRAVEGSARLKAFMELDVETAEEYADAMFFSQYDYKRLNEGLSTPVVSGHVVEHWQSYTSGSSHTTGGSSTESESFSESASGTQSRARTIPEGEIFPDGMLTIGQSVQEGSGHQSGSSRTDLDTRTESSSVTTSPTLVPITEERHMQTLSPEEQRNEFKKMLCQQQAGYGWIMLPESRKHGVPRVPVLVHVEFQESEAISDENLEQAKLRYCTQSERYALAEEVRIHLADKGRELIGAMHRNVPMVDMSNPALSYIEEDNEEPEEDDPFAPIGIEPQDK